MKKYIHILIAVLFCLPQVSFAQTSDSHAGGSFYASIDYSAFGGKWFNLNKSDLMLSSFELAPGYQFGMGLAIFMPLSLDDIHYNQEDSHNYNLLGSLGLGLSYELALGNDSDFLEFVAEGKRSVCHTDFAAYTAGVDIRYGFTRNGCVLPYVGLGFRYLNPVGIDRLDSYMLGVSFGVRFNYAFYEK